MFNRIKDFFARSIYALPVICAVLVLGGFLSAGAYYLYKNKPNLDIAKIPLPQSSNNDSTVSAPPDEEAIEQISANPPSTNTGSISSKKISTSAGNAVVVSTGNIGDSGDDKINQFASEGPTSSFAYVDQTGQYPNLGQQLKSYLDSTLLHSNEVSYLFEVDIEDCPTCDYGGYWTGSYLYQGSDIIKAFGYITLNVSSFKSSPYFLDYMKLTFSHEYGHHYTMYHRWVDMDIPSGQRFPAQYYSLRGLTTSTVAPDYSLGWVNCDAEIIAEDFSYFYSTYNYSGVASIHGYPTSAVKSYIEAMSGASSPTTTTVTTPVASEPAPDTTPPQITIIAPTASSTVSGEISLSAQVSDNDGILKVEYYVDGALKASTPYSPYAVSYDTSSLSNSQHTLVAKAYDNSGNYSTDSVVFTVNNQAASDTVKPVVTISAPASNPYAWTSKNLQLAASASDDTGVTKIEFYINGTKVAEEYAAQIIRIWSYTGTPAGSYQLSAKAYDAAGNIGETSITINKS